MADTNPIKQVYDGLWIVLEAHSGFTDIVLAGDRIRFTKGLLDVDKKRQPIKRRTLDTDYNEVRIVPVGATAFMRTTSTGTRLDMDYRIEARTKDQQYDDLALLMWETFRAMMDWRTATDGAGSTALASMTWASKTFVTDISMRQRQEALGDDNKIRGWQSLWVGRVRLDFDTSDM